MSKKGLVHGVGNMDLPGWSTSPNPRRRWVYSEWKHMIARCYSNSLHEQCPTYKDCTCCERWLTFSNFVNDAPLLPGFDKVIAFEFKGVALDKDSRVVGNKEYSPDTCCWLTHSENSKERLNRLGHPMLDPSVVKKAHAVEANQNRAVSQGRPVIAISPDGVATEYFGTAEAARQLQICYNIIRNACTCRSGSHTLRKGKFKDWSFYWKDEYTGGC